MNIQEDKYFLKLLCTIYDDYNKVSGCNYYKDSMNKTNTFFKEDIKSKVFCIFTSISYIITILSSFIINRFNLTILTYILCLGFSLELILYNLIQNFKNRHRMYKLIKYLRFFNKYIGFLCFFIFPFMSQRIEVIRILYFIIVYMNILFRYYAENHFILILMMISLNSSVIVFAQIKFNLDTYFYLLPELIANLIFYLSTYFLDKKEHEMSKKDIFTQYIKGQCEIYLKQLVESLDLQLICKDKKEILFMNNNAFNYLEKNFPDDISYVNNLHNISNSFNKSFNDKLDSFFKHVILTSPNSILNLEKGKKLNEILDEFNLHQEIVNMKFIRLGIFRFNTESYVIYARKLRIREEEEATEILIKEISKLQQEEQEKIENDIRNNLVSKISHEFKTPLITIISLIEKLITQQTSSGFTNKDSINYMKHIYNYSNYLIILTKEIILHLNGSKKVKIIKKPINLREILDFGFNILNTLIKCNENKENTITTFKNVSDDINQAEGYSDENLVKIILLNFISNAVKFTSSGFIKTKAIYNKEKNYLEISVKDTGIGIRDEVQHLILRESNKRCSLKDNYFMNRRSTGLSLCKKIAQDLNHEIGFISKPNIGSKFYIRIMCNNTKLQTVTYIQAIDPNMDVNSSIVDQTETKECFFNKKITYFEDTRKIRSIMEEEENNVVLFDSDESTVKITKRRNFDFERVEDYEFINYNDYFHQNLLKINCLSFSINSLYNNVITNSNIIVVDDNKHVREYTVNLIQNVLNSLKINDCSILQGSDGIELLNFIRLDKEKRIKCIFIDENMEYMNGSEAVTIIRKLEQLNKIRKYHIVSITAYEGDEMKNKLINSGLNSVIIKPCNKSEVSNVLKRLLKV